MGNSTISITTAFTVTPGYFIFDDDVTITSAGTIAPIASSVSGVLLQDVSRNEGVLVVVNAGLIRGGPGAAYSSPGGAGVSIAAAASTLSNSGNIIGGLGNTVAYDDAGGNGVFSKATGVVINNTGTIEGGAGGNAAYSPFGHNPAASGGVGIYIIRGGDFLTNTGTIFGGRYGIRGAGGGYGGAGLIADGPGNEIVNGGLISGGLGGAVYNGERPIPSGGTGVYLGALSTMVNRGEVEGGACQQFGGYQGYYGGNGGIAVYSQTGADLTNMGLLLGGAGGGNSDTGGTGGDGVKLSGSSTLTNSGTIFGGTGGAGSTIASAGGTGIFATGAATIANSAKITGGAGGVGGAGIYLGAGANLNNTGLLQGGNALYPVVSHVAAGAGGDGVTIHGPALLTNGGTIIGGIGGNAIYANGGYGGAGVAAASAARIVNSGVIIGGIGGGASNGGAAGPGGVGVGLYSNGSMSNTGLIIGGAGAGGVYGGGSGGAGADIDSGSVLTNTGTILGGAGGSGMRSAAYGANGVDLAGGTLINAGTITGGAGGIYDGTRYGQGDAVYTSFFGTVGSTLIVDPGAVFNGEVFLHAKDTINLSGTSKTVLAGFGTSISGAGHISFASGAAWTISGNQAGLASGQTIAGFTSSDALDLTFIKYNTKDTVTAAQTGVVSIRAGSKTYKLDLAGATKGETDFKLTKDATGGTYLTKTAPPPAMSFISPTTTTTIAMAATVPALDFAGGWFGTAAAVLHGETVTRGYLGAATELLLRENHRGIANLVTLQSG